MAVKTIQSLREFHQARAMRFRMVVIVSILPLVMVLAKSAMDYETSPDFSILVEQKFSV